MAAVLLRQARSFAREQDKQKHFAVCLVLTTGLLLLATPVGKTIAIVTAIGLAKELWDRRYGTGFCWYDMLANALGTLCGLVLLLPVTL